MNTYNEIPTNGVIERATQLSQLSPCNYTVVDQTGRGRHPTAGTTSRKKYTTEDNIVILKCYYQSNLENTVYRRRMSELWKELDRFEISEQRMADQVRTIFKKKWFTAG